MALRDSAPLLDSRPARAMTEYDTGYDAASRAITFRDVNGRVSTLHPHQRCQLPHPAEHAAGWQQCGAGAR